jgi:hypothetical protein
MSVRHPDTLSSRRTDRRATARNLRHTALARGVEATACMHIDSCLESPASIPSEPPSPPPPRRTKQRAPSFLGPSPSSPLLDHQPAFRAAVEAAPALAELAAKVPDTNLVGALVLLCIDLVDGFAAPPDSRRRIRAHRRAWVAVRELDRLVVAIGRRRLAPVPTIQAAQRAIDRADVLIGALLPA